MEAYRATEPKTRINYRVLVLLNGIRVETDVIANTVDALLPDLIRDLRLSYTLATLCRCPISSISSGIATRLP